MNFNRPFLYIASYLISVFPAVLFAKLNVVTSTTDLAWVAEQIGLQNVSVKSLLTGTENPHYVDAVPSFVLAVSNADVVCSVGLELEVGWLPKVLSKSGNAKVQPGGQGFCEIGKKIKVLDKLDGQVDRSMGDVHPGGNPHFWLSPLSLVEAAKHMMEVFIQNDPQHQKQYQSAFENFQKQMVELVDSNLLKLSKALKTLNSSCSFMEYHKEFAYFFKVYNLVSKGALEEKPGVSPSAGRIGEVALSAKSSGVKLLLAGNYAPNGPLEKFTELSKIKFKKVSTSINPSAGIKTYGELQSLIVDAVIESIKP